MRDPRRAFFDQRAANWEDYCYPPDLRGRVAPLVEMFHIQPGTTVLDMGTGTGILHPYLLSAVGKNGLVLAFDLSFRMLKEAEKKSRYRHLYCLQATAMQLPLPEKKFDHIVCFAAFPHFSAKEIALQEIARVAKPGAELVIAHLYSREELLQRHKPHPAVQDDLLPNNEEMSRLLREAGFTLPTVRDEPGLYLARALKY